MKALIISILLVTCASLVSGCNQEHVANRGFSLPIGDAESGRVLFRQLQCVECHTIAGSDSVVKQAKPTEDNGFFVELGGTSSRVQTYGDLVTSIINPSHRLAKGYELELIANDGESKMRHYNDVLTVEQLIDLVTYLKPQYKFRSYPDTHYPRYR